MNHKIYATTIFKLFLLVFLFCLQYPLSTKAQSCGCVPLLYEGFDYPEAETMNQRVGGTGWGGAWEQQSQTDTRVGFRVGANTLNYSNLRSNYKSFVGGHYWHLIGRPLDLSATGALAAYRRDDGQLGKAGTTLWTSAVFQKTQNNDEQTWFGLHNTGVPWYVRESRYGSWGHLEEIDQNTTTQPAPKYQVLLDNFRSGQPACNTTTLPLKMRDFTSNCSQDGHIELKWETIDELDVQQYDIQTSTDGQKWVTARSVTTKGNSATPQSYNTLFRNEGRENNILYYCLRIRFNDSTEEYSKTIALQCYNKKLPQTKVYPNPVSTVLTIENAEGKAFEVVNTLGQTMLRGNIQSYSLDVQSLLTGFYVLKINSGRTFETTSFFKN